MLDFQKRLRIINVWQINERIPLPFLLEEKAAKLVAASELRT